MDTFKLGPMLWASNSKNSIKIPIQSIEFKLTMELN